MEKEKKSIVKTLKIQIRVFEADTEKKNAYYQKLRDLNEAVMRMANTAATHLYIQKNLDEFEYINNDYKKHSVEVFEQGKGLSPNNRSYRVLSKKYNDDVKGLSDVTTNLNSQLCQTFRAESKEYFTGNRSLRTYRKDIPVPFSAYSIVDIKETEDKKDYYFTLFKIPFVTRFGKDLSGSRQKWERSLNGDYKLCNSSFQFKKGKLFLLAVFQFEPDIKILDTEKIAEAFLSPEYPIVFRNKLYEYTIGHKDEFYHQRNAIQEALRRQRIAAKYNNGGRGRKKKLANCDRFEKKEHNYVQTRQHTYSKMLIDMCVKQKCGTLVLRFPQELTPPEELSYQEKQKWNEVNNPIFRNWGYHGLTQKIQYKCSAAGIKLIIENGKQETAETEKLPKKRPVRINKSSKRGVEKGMVEETA